jgi:hypothetical protein
MRMLNSFILVFFISLVALNNSFSQSVIVNNAFRLGSPYNEPDGRNDIVKINATDFVTIAKVKGNATGKSDFMLERYDGSNLTPKWQVSLSVETFEDFKDLYFNGKEIVLLSVIHNENEKNTKLEGYGFDISSGIKTWTKEMETYNVKDWEANGHKGKVKESFIDVICEHANRSFITPFEYKHNIHFSPDQSKFISYVFDYGQKNLMANISVYDNACNLLNRGVVTIDNDFINHGIYINNKGTVFIVNANNSGKLNFIQFDLASKAFTLLELPPSSYQKDDFQIQFQNDDIIYIGNSEIAQGKVVGVMFSKFDFKNKKLEKSIYHEFSPEFKSQVVKERAAKGIKGEEDWRDYDITDFIIEKDGNILFLLEKRSLYAEGYPHVSRDMFDKSHAVEFAGHVHSEGILMLYFKDDLLEWADYIAKNQVYPANDGLNSVSFAMDNSKAASIRILYATSEGVDGMLSTLNLVTIDRSTGVKTGPLILPNKDKLSLVKDYTLWPEDNSIVIVGKKGLLGKSSIIAKYKL